MASLTEPDYPNEPNEIVQRVVRALADGTDVDWADFSREQDDTNGPVLGQLRVLADLAAVHRVDLDDDSTPEWWGHLRLIQQVGRGAFGTVYSAWDSRLDRDVALKLVRVRSAGDRAPESTFIEEARLLARVRHPNVVTVYGAERIDGRDGIWTEFIHGRTMAEIVRVDGPLEPDEVTSIGVDVCRAIGAIHAAGLLHRDIKAQNVMREDNGRIVVMDLGAGTEHPTAEQPGASALLGTPLYLAPEILAGQSPIVQGDVYSLGVLLYHLLTGSFPVFGDRLETARDAHARGERVPIEARRRDVPARLAKLVTKAIAPEPSDRFLSVEDLRASLERCLPAHRKRRRILIGGVAVAMLTIAGLGGTARWAWERLSNVGFSATATFKQISSSGDITEAALSPDGTTMAYVADDSDGFRLMVRDLSTSSARELWRSGMLLRPRWSRDGSKLAFYATDGNAATGGQWTIPKQGGTPRRLAPGGFLAWSPEGERVANAKADYRRIEIISTTGDVLQRIPLPELRWILAVDWQKSSEHIAVLGQNAERQFEVWKVSADGATRALVHRDSFVLTSSRWSPTEDMIYCLRRRDDGTELIAIDGQGRGAARVVSSLSPGADGLSLSPDGTSALFVQSRSWTNLWRFDLGGREGGPQPITHGTGNYTRPRISPDGQWIAAVFASEPASESNTHLVKIPSGGGDAVSLTNANARDDLPAWSLDGQRIAFGSNRDGSPGIWVMSAEGGAPENLQLAFVNPNMHVFWTPSGHIAWQQSVPGSRFSKIRLRDLASGEEASLSAETSEGHEYNLRFSPRADRVALQITGQGQIGLWSLSWPGRVKTYLAPDMVPIGWSAAGDWIFGYRMLPNGSPSIWRVASGGGPASAIGRAKSGRIVGGDVSKGGKWIILSVQETTGDVWMVHGLKARN